MKNNKRKRYKINEKNTPGKGSENSNDQHIARYRAFRPLDNAEGGMIEIGIERGYKTSRELLKDTWDSNEYFESALAAGVSQSEWDMMKEIINEGIRNKTVEKGIKEAEEESNAPALVDDPGIVAMLNDPRIGEYIQELKGEGITLSEEMLASLGFAGASGVKVHTDDMAILLCELLNARAFAYGNDIFFNEGEFVPGSSEGNELLSHELTHVLIQSNQNAKIQRQTKKIEDEVKNFDLVHLTTETIQKIYNLLEAFPLEAREDFYSKYPLVEMAINKYAKANELNILDTHSYEVSNHPAIARVLEKKLKGANPKPEEAIEAYNYIKKKLPDAVDRSLFYSKYPGIIEKMEANLPAEFVSSHNFGFDKGYILSEKEMEEEIQKYELTNPEIASLLSQVQRNDITTEEFLVKTKKYTNNTGLRKFIGAYLNTFVGKGKHGRRFGTILYSAKRNKNRSVTSQNINLAEMQETMGGHFSGFKISENKNISEITVSNSESQNQLKISNLPLERVDLASSSFTLRMGKGEMNGIDLIYNETKDKAGKKVEETHENEEGKTHIENATLSLEVPYLDIRDFIFSMPKETYAIGHIAVQKLKISVTKDFVVEKQKTYEFYFGLLGSIFKDSLPHLMNAILQLKSQMSGSTQEEAGELNKEVVNAFTSDISGLTTLNLKFEKLDIDNFVMVGTKIDPVTKEETGTVETIQKMKVGTMDMTMTSNTNVPGTENRDEELRNWKIELYNKRKELLELKGKSLRKQEHGKKNRIEILEREIPVLENKIAEKENSLRKTRVTIKGSGVELEGANYLENMVSAQMESKGWAKGVHVQGIKADKFELTSDLTAQGASNTIIDLKGFKIPQLSVDSISFSTADQQNLVLAPNGGVFNGINVDTILTYTPTSDAVPDVKISKIDIEYALFKGQTEIMLKGKCISLDEKGAELKGIHVILGEGDYLKLDAGSITAEGVSDLLGHRIRNLKTTGLHVEQVGDVYTSIVADTMDATYERAEDGTVTSVHVNSKDLKVTIEDNTYCVENLHIDEIGIDELKMGGGSDSKYFIQIPKTSNKSALRGINVNAELKMEKDGKTPQYLIITDFNINEIEAWGLKASYEMGEDKVMTIDTPLNKAAKINDIKVKDLQYNSGKLQSMKSEIGSFNSADIKLAITNTLAAGGDVSTGKITYNVNKDGSEEILIDKPDVKNGYITLFDKDGKEKPLKFDTDNIHVTKIGISTDKDGKQHYFAIDPLVKNVHFTLNGDTYSMDVKMPGRIDINEVDKVDFASELASAWMINSSSGLEITSLKFTSSALALGDGKTEEQRQYEQGLNNYNSMPERTPFNDVSRFYTDPMKRLTDFSIQPAEPIIDTDIYLAKMYCREYMELNPAGDPIAIYQVRGLKGLQQETERLRKAQRLSKLFKIADNEKIIDGQQVNEGVTGAINLSILGSEYSNVQVNVINGLVRVDTFLYQISDAITSYVRSQGPNLLNDEEYKELVKYAEDLDESVYWGSAFDSDNSFGREAGALMDELFDPEGEYNNKSEKGGMDIISNFLEGVQEGKASVAPHLANLIRDYEAWTSINYQKDPVTIKVLDKIGLLVNIPYLMDKGVSANILDTTEIPICRKEDYVDDGAFKISGLLDFWTKKNAKEPEKDPLASKMSFNTLAERMRIQQLSFVEMMKEINKNEDWDGDLKFERYSATIWPFFQEWIQSKLQSLILKDFKIVSVKLDKLNPIAIADYVNSMPNAGILKFTNPTDKLSLEMPASDMKQASIPTQVIPAFSYITPNREMKIQSGEITITNTEINRKETEGSISAQKIKSDSLKIFIKK